MVNETPQPLILRYGVAVLAVAAALTINRLLNLNLLGAPAILLFCAVMFSAWYGGVKPSLLAMPLAVLAFAYYFVTPVNSWSIDPREIPRLSLFVMACLFVISLSAAQRRRAVSCKRLLDGAQLTGALTPCPPILSNNCPSFMVAPRARYLQITFGETLSDKARSLNQRNRSHIPRLNVRLKPMQFEMFERIPKH